MGKPLARGEAAEVTISGINSRGEGIARTDEGFVLFVPQGLPGERVRVAVVEAKRQYAVGHLQEILGPHPRRVSPPCPWFGACGGCQLQHADKILQTELKGALVQDALTRLGGGVPETGFEACRPSSVLWGYRNKAAFPAVFHPSGGLRLGFYREGSHRIVPLRQCPVVDPRLEGLFISLRPLLEKGALTGYDEKKHSGDLRHLVLRGGIRTDHVACVLVVRAPLSSPQERWLREKILPVVRSAAKRYTLAVHIHGAPGNTIWGGTTEIVGGESFLSERLGDFSYTYDVTSFFQVNPTQAEELFSHVANLVKASRPSRTLELYAGVGSLTTFLARLGGEVTAVESWVASVESSRHNLGRAGFRQVRTVCADVKAYLADPGERPDVVVMDPPRTGCEEEVLHRLGALASKTLVYVSCNPATLARDVGVLRQEGYKLSRVTPFDLFPQTAHVESVALLHREVSPSP